MKNYSIFFSKMYFNFDTIYKAERKILDDMSKKF